MYLGIWVSICLRLVFHRRYQWVVVVNQAGNIVFYSCVGGLVGVTN